MGWKGQGIIYGSALPCCILFSTLSNLPVCIIILQYICLISTVLHVSECSQIRKWSTFANIILQTFCPCIRMYVYYM